MIGLKTAVLIACAAKMGALIAEAPAQICDALYKYGYELGIAFQITDDYLDTFGDESVFGKKIGGDIVNNKKNWLLVEALHRTNSVGEQSRRLAELMAMGEDRSEEKIAGMQQIYVELGIKEDAALAIKEHHFRALNTIDNIGLSEEQVAVLNEFAEQLVYRES
jgi:geranylgeranyl diphosphate synthase type II